MNWDRFNAGRWSARQGRTTFFFGFQGRDSSELKLTVFNANGTVRTVMSSTPKRAEWWCVVFRVFNLDENTEYEYSLKSAHGETARFRFRTRMPSSARRVRIAFCSCVQDRASSAAAFAWVEHVRPRLFIMLGDNSYFYEVGVDEEAHLSEERMMKAYLRFRKAAGLRSVTSEVSTVAVWDDHDYGRHHSERRNHWALRGQRRHAYLRAESGSV